MKGFEKMTVRFFIVDRDSEELDIKEVNEADFIDDDEKNIDYERHTIHANGCSQICLTKMPRG